MAAIRKSRQSVDGVELQRPPQDTPLKDVTIPRNRARQNSQTGAADYEALLNQASDGIFILSADGNYLDANPSGCEMLGYTRDELLAHNIKEIVAPESLDQVLSAFDDLRAGIAVREERTMCRKDGARIIVEASTKALDDGRMLSILRDVTEQKRSEQALIESETRYRQMFERNRAVKLLIDPESGAIVDANPAAAEFYGYTLDELKHVNISDINTLPKDEVAEEMARARTEKRDYFQFRHRLSSGEVRDVEVHSGPIDLGGQQLLYSIIHDITGRKDAEAAIRRLNQDLERKVEQRTSQLRAANRRLEEDLLERKQAEKERELLLDEVQRSVRVREDLLSMVSHDLKNPLGVIKGFSQLAHRRVVRSGDIDREQLAEMLEKIDSTTQRMNKMIDDLLDFARIQAGQPLDLQHRPTNLVSLAHQIVGEVQQTTNRHQIIVKAEVPELISDWDEARLGRMLDNLLSNAVKYSPDGGEVTVTVSRENGKHGSWAVLSVRDQGMGISKDDLPHIFKWYRRAGNVSEHVTGTGVGLASARQVIEQHGGSISVESQEGKGSTFTVRLPL